MLRPRPTSTASRPLGSHTSRPSTNKQQRAWTSGSNFDTLGWGPDGNVRGSYNVDTATTDFTVQGFSDVDGDGSDTYYTAQKTANATMLSGNNVY